MASQASDYSSGGISADTGTGTEGGGSRDNLTVLKDHHAKDEKNKLCCKLTKNCVMFFLDIDSACRPTVLAQLLEHPLDSQETRAQNRDTCCPTLRRWVQMDF